MAAWKVVFYEEFGGILANFNLPFTNSNNRKQIKLLQFEIFLNSFESNVVFQVGQGKDKIK